MENNGKIIIVKSLKEAAALSDFLAPEHLELCVQEPFEYMKDIHNAGSVFLGYGTPEAVGDYYAGANHTLPTGGTARFASALGVHDFVKSTQYIYYDDASLKAAAADIERFAESEGLSAHARSVAKRCENE